MPKLSIIIPTYNEKGNIPILAERVFRAISGKIGYEIVVIDDNSNDGTIEAVNNLASKYNSRIIVRQNERGLASAVLKGIAESKSPLILIMDADLSHPPEIIPEMLDNLTENVDIVIGSRYVKGGSTYNWAPFRWFNSKVASLLVKPLAKIKDPLAGFFIFRRTLLTKSSQLKPLGYKILLEIIVKSRTKRIVEVPINFSNRFYGQSKFSFKEKFKFILQLLLLYFYKLRFLFTR